MIELIRNWNRKRLESRHHHNKLISKLESKIDALTKQVHWLQQAFLDNGLSNLKLRVEVLNCPKHYEYLLFSIRPGDIVIDGGANLGLFSDLMLELGAKVFAFEPNPALTYHLNKKYLNNENLTLFQKAISVKDENLVFSMPMNSSFIEQSQGGSFVFDLSNQAKFDYHVKAIDFCKFIDSLLEETQQEKVKLIKLDIEGAEFEVLNQIIDQEAYKKFDCLLVETHERFFEDGQQKLSLIKEKMEKKNITNIRLDWI